MLNELNFGTMGRNEKASYFLENYHLLSPKGLNKLLPEIWTMCEWPGLAYDYLEWIHIFYDALEYGFVSDDGSERPTDYKSKINLYRAATEEYARGIAWTTSLETAKWFNERNRMFGWEDSAIYQITVPKGIILAIFNKRKEHEVIIDLEDIDAFGGIKKYKAIENTNKEMEI